MKQYLLFFFLLFSAALQAQKHTHLPHGMVFGTNPDTSNMMAASKLQAYMDNRVRVSTTIEGKVIKVTKAKGGWFEVDADDGKIIAAHFKVYNIMLPTDLAGRTVIIEGVAQKQFIADDLQHFAGDTVTGKKQHTVKTNPKRVLIFEVNGLMVDK
jgi:hypothetical protein